jgi:hypothetical protein
MERSRALAKQPYPGLPPPPPRRNRLLCHLTTLHPERSLSIALVDHLASEMRDIDFTLAGGGAPDVVWVCGFEPGAEGLVADLRRLQPGALIVVTGRGEVESWEEGVCAAGADLCCGWPLPVEELSEILHASRRERAS